MIDVCLVTLKYPPLLGGDASHTQQLAKELSRRGYRVAVVTIKPKKKPLPRYEGSVWVERVGVGSETTELERFCLKRALFIICAFAALAKLWARAGIRVIHSHGWDPGLVCGLFSLITRAKLVHTLHGIPRVGGLLALWERLVLKLCSTARAFFITLNPEDAELAASMGVPRNRVRTIPNAIDVERLSRGDAEAFRLRYGLRRGEAVAIFVGRLHAQKGVDTLIRAARLLQDHPIKFFVIGSGHEARRYLEEARGLSNLRFLGEVSEDVLSQAYAACDIFVLPSVFEGMPYALMEAMALGKAVVASDIEGVKTLVKDGETGLLFPPRDPQALAERIKVLCENPELRRKLGKNARELVLSRYSWESVLDKLLRLYGVIPFG